MRHARRLTAIIIGCATWAVFAATYASATMLPDPVPAGSADLTRASSSSGTPLWQYVAALTLGVLFILAVMGLMSSLRHTWRHSPRHPGRTKPPLHA